MPMPYSVEYLVVLYPHGPEVQFFLQKVSFSYSLQIESIIELNLSFY
jgi:hypothetical protein